MEKIQHFQRNKQDTQTHQKSTKKSLIHDLLKRLLGLEFKSNHSIKSKCLKWIVQKILPTIYDMKSTRSKIKAIKTGKELGTMYCLGSKDNTQNFKPPEVNMTNKVLRIKSNGAVCRSSLSKFLKQKNNKNMQIYCKNLKNT